MNLLLRLLLVIAGLIFAFSLAVMMLVLMMLWAVRGLWRKLTGQPVAPFVMRMNPRAGFEQVFRREKPVGGAAAQAPSRDLHNVTDVEPKG